MTIQIIGWYCIAHAILSEIAVISSIISKDTVETGARARVNFMVIGYFAVAAWCLK